MNDAVLETGRLILRRFRDTDRAPWMAHMNTPAVRAHLGGVTSDQACADRFERQRKSWDDERGGWLAIERREDAAFLGNCGFGPIASTDAPEALRGAHDMGWALRADCWGQGYASEAAGSLLGAIFTRFGLDTIYAQTSQTNRASWTLMERLGMTRRAELDYHDPGYPDEDNPTMVYSIDGERWRSRL
jgi:RimJ/RimL family protein N-acetyltransferase